MLDQGH